MGDINETISVDAAPGIAGLKEFTAALEQASGKWSKFEAKMSRGFGGAGGDKLAAGMDKTAASISAAADKAAASLERINGAASSAAGGMRSAAAGAGEMAAASDRLAASADAGAASLERQAVAGERAGKASKESAAGGTRFWKGLGTVMLGAGVAAAYGIDKAMKFQAQMLLLHTQAGVSVKDTQAMSQGVLKVSTQTGQPLNALAESAYHVASNMASMGATVPQMLGAVKVAAEGASVGHSNLVDTTNAMTAAIASGIPGVKNYQQAMGVLNATVGSGDMSMQDLADAFGGGMVATVKGYGLTLKDVGAATAVFGDNNIRGAKAGTDLRMAVQALAVPMKTAPLKEFGLQQDTLAKDMQKGGLTKALDDLTARFHKVGLTGKTEGEAITSLFGKKAGSGIAVLLEQMDRYHSKLPLLTKDANTFGKAWEATQATPAQKWKEAVAGLQASAVGFGTQLLPAFSVAVGWADKLLAAINGSKAGAKGIAVAFGGMAALFTAKKLVSGVEGAFKTAETGLRGVGKVAQILHIPGLDKLAGIGKAGGIEAAMVSGGRAAGAEIQAAMTAGGRAAAAEMDAGVAAGGRTAGAEMDAGVAGGAGKKGGGGLGAVVGKGLMAVVGVEIAKSILQSIPSGPGGKNWYENPFGMPGPHDKKSAGNWLTSWSPYERAAGTVGRFFGGSGGSGVPSARSLALGGYHDVFAAPQQVARLSAAIPRIDTSQIGLRGLREGGKLPKIPAPEVGKPKVPAPDLGPFNAAMASAMHKPAKLAPPDLSALSSAKGKAQSDAKAITTAMETSLHKPVKATKPDLSSYTAAAGAARADGAAISAGLAGGILAGEGAVVAAAGQVASAAAAAMASAVKARSPSRVTHKIGEDTATGFEHGIRSKTHAVKAASAALSAAAVTGLTQGLQGGKSAIDAAMQAITGKGARPQDLTTIMNTISTLKGDVSRAVSKGVIGQVEGSKLSVLLDLDNHRLQGLATRRARLIQEITDAQQVAQGVISGASIMGAGGYTPALAASSGPLSAYATVSGMQAQAADQTTFAQQVKQLRKMGLNSTSLDQIIQAGAQQGLPIAEGLTQGGAGQIKQLNQAEKQIHAAASSIGDTGGQAMYEAGQQAGQGIAEGLKSQLSAVDAAMKDIAQHMMSTLEHALAGHAAGKTKHGKAAAHAAVHAVAGAASSAASSAGGTGTLHIPSLGGLAQMAHSAATALGRDAAAGNRAAAALDHLASAAGRVAAGHHGGHHHGGGGNVTYVTNVHVTVQGSVTSEGDLLSKLQTLQLKRANNNWQGGWRLPGRAN